MEPVIETAGLSRRFNGNWAVRQLSLSIERGCVFGFLGPNGAGKTTTVRLLNGILEPTEGKATVLGMDPSTQGASVRRQTGVLTENPSLYEALSARENLVFFGEVYGVAREMLPERIETLLHRFGLGDRADDKVGTYSRGAWRLPVPSCMIQKYCYWMNHILGWIKMRAPCLMMFYAKLQREDARW